MMWQHVHVYVSMSLLIKHNPKCWAF